MRTMTLKDFTDREDGTATVEFALWLPLLALILMFAADASMLMHRQTLIYDAVRDASRQVVTGVSDVDEAQDQLARRLHTGATGSNPYTANVTRSDNYIYAELSVPFTEVAIFAHAFFADDAALKGSVVMWDAASAIAQAQAQEETEEEGSSL